MQTSANISQYMERGEVQFEKVLAISLHGRIPNLTHVYGIEKIHAVLTALVGSFNNSLNLIRPMSEEQIVQCAHELVMTTEEDQLSIEDYVLFFKGAREGKYGRILDRLDQQTIFEMLEQYRQCRHVAYQATKYEREQQFKTLPINDTITDLFDDEREKMREAMNVYLKTNQAKDNDVPPAA